MIKRLILIVAFTIFPGPGFTAEYILTASQEQGVARVGVPFPLTIRFYWDTCCIRSPKFSDIHLSSADITGPGLPEQYEQEIDGKKFGVYELEFTVTPRTEGTLVIPKVIMTGERVEPTRVFSVSPDEVLPTMEVESEPLTIRVVQ